MDTIKPILKITHQNYSPYVSLFFIFDFIWILLGLIIFFRVWIRVYVVGYDGGVVMGLCVLVFGNLWVLGEEETKIE